MTPAAIAWTIYFFVVGTAVGSFLNVCIWRLPRRCLSIFRPARSFCPSCKHGIAWYDNIPLLSWMLLGGKCRHCKGRIGVRYAIVELVTGGAFAFFYAQDMAMAKEPSWALLFVHLLLTSAIIAASFIDWEWMIIPDRISKPGMALAPVIGLVLPQIYGSSLIVVPAALLLPSSVAGNEHFRALVTAATGMAAGAGIIYGMGVFGKVLFRKEAMGFGDVKYMAMIGGFLGWQGVGIAIFLACLLGSVIGVLRKVITGDSYIPFGPFLGAGAVAVMAHGDLLLRWAHFRFGEIIRLTMGNLGPGFLLALILLLSGIAVGILLRGARKQAS